jgi:hypothetical protein
VLSKRDRISYLFFCRWPILSVLALTLLPLLNSRIPDMVVMPRSWAVLASMLALVTVWAVCSGLKL